MANEDEIIQDFQHMTEALEKLAANPEAFNDAYNAFTATDATKFNAALDRVGIAEHCRLICRFFCRKRCGGRCFKFCPKPNREEVNVKEILAFTQAVTPFLKSEETVKWLLNISDTENVDEWNRFLRENKLEIFCYQLCILLCSMRCKRKCIDLCPPNPLITNVGSIPISQINTSGDGNGPSIPSGFVGLPNPSAGYGDHPFGGGIIIKGIFNMASATEYLLEVSSTGPGGPYSPIIESPQVGDDYFPLQLPLPVPPDAPFPGPRWIGIVYPRNRSQSPNPDPGWFQINQLCDSDGGRLTSGEKSLMQWSSSVLNGIPTIDGVYYLRLRVRDALMNTRVSSPQVLLLDNTGPFPLPRPIITLQLEKNDGTLVPLKCGKVHKGDGLILITIHAYDPNMSQVSVTARGNSGLSVPVVSNAMVPLSKNYNGNIFDQGYPVPTQFRWDPWSDPNIVPCCYLIYVEINDRAILGNRYDGGHSNSGWEAIEIGL
jgi:hypothetical protein